MKAGYGMQTHNYKKSTIATETESTEPLELQKTALFKCSSRTKFIKSHATIFHQSTLGTIKIWDRITEPLIVTDASYKDGNSKCLQQQES
jgi:hypothetical protein